MKDLNEEELKIKFNNYMEQIKVPENLGGIIMEDFEKMKNEENQENVQNVEQRTNENAQNVNSEGNVKKKKNHTVLKISLGSVAAVVLVGTGIFVGTQLTGNKTVIFDNHGAQSVNMAGENNAQSYSTANLSKYLGRWYSSDASLNIKSIDNDEIKFDIGLYRLAGMDDAVGTLKNESIAEFKGKLDGVHDTTGTIEFNENSIVVTFTSSDYKLLPLNYKIEFQREDPLHLITTENEISEIENFINDLKNQAFALTNYDNPEDLLKHEQNMSNIDRILSYSINQSEYAIPANAEQNKVIWEKTNGDAVISTRVVDIKDIVKFLKEKTNYDYSEAEVRDCFKVNSDLDKYVIKISDTIFINYSVKNVTKNGDKYNVTLYNRDSVRNDDPYVDVVLTKDNGKYYFYSCNLNNFNKISQEKTAQLENFINDPGNHAFVYMNYNSSKDLVSETYDAKKAQTIVQSLIEGGYAKSITEQELKIVGNQEKPTYTISLEDLDKFLQEKTNTGFGQDALKKAFKYEYNEKLGKLVIQTAGALDKDNKIVDVYKAGNYEYWLKLSKGQEVVLFERTNGEIFFKSCTGYKNQ